MPQMSPMLWELIFSFTIMLMVLLSNKLYFIYLTKKIDKIHFNLNFKQKVNKWVW